jgi:hypothetical protein
MRRHAHRILGSRTCEEVMTDCPFRFGRRACRSRPSTQRAYLEPRPIHSAVMTEPVTGLIEYNGAHHRSRHADSSLCTSRRPRRSRPTVAVNCCSDRADTAVPFRESSSEANVRLAAVRSRRPAEVSSIADDRQSSGLGRRQQRSAASTRPPSLLVPPIEIVGGARARVDSVPQLGLETHQLAEQLDQLRARHLSSARYPTLNPTTARYASPCPPPGINPEDVKKRAGWQVSTMPFARVIPQRNGATTIDAIGLSVATERVGQRVWCYGAQS